MELNSMGEVSLLDYNNLEKALQKNESEIRNHIRVYKKIKSSCIFFVLVRRNNN